MIRSREDRWFLRFCRTGDARALARVFDRTAPELWRVAAHLCRDHHDAEDAVQNTFLSAIEYRDDWERARPLLPWLLGMLANRAREQRRWRQRVPDAERIVRGGGEADPAVTAEVSEFGAELRGALARLQEPYRSTLEQHVLHGLAAHEIADELGVPAGTVRMRLHRGLDELRRRLPQGLAAVAMVPREMPPATCARLRAGVLAGAPAVVVGSVLGHGVSALMAVGLVALMAVTTWLVLPRRADAVVTPSEHAQVATAEVDHGARVADATQATGNAESVERVPVAANVATSGTLRLRVRNAATKSGVARMQVGVIAGLAGPEVPAAGASPEQSAKTVQKQDLTDPDGRIALDLPIGFARVWVNTIPATIEFFEVRAGKSPEHVIDAEPITFPEVSVLDAQGAPVADARIVGRTDYDYDARTTQVFGRSNRDGKWSGEFVQHHVTLCALVDGAVASTPVVVEAGHVPVVLRLGGEAATIDGSIFDAAGRPVQDAGIAVLIPSGATFEKEPLVVRSDVDGHFVCDMVPPGPVVLFAWCEVQPKVNRIARVHVETRASAVTPVTMRFTQGATLAVQLRHDDGSPWIDSGVGVTPMTAQVPAMLLSIASAHGKTDRDGRCELSGLVDGSYAVHLQGWRTAFTQSVSLVDGQRCEIEHVFGARGVIDVTVVDAEQHPVAGVTVMIRESDASSVGQRTNADGVFHFEPLDPGDYTIVVMRSEGELPCVTQVVHTGQPARILLPPTTHEGRIEGVLVASPGSDLRDLTVELMRAQPSSVSIPDFLLLRIDPDSGRFSRAGVPPGRYDLVVQLRSRPSCVALRTNLEIAAGGTLDLGRIELGTGSVDVDISGPAGASIEQPLALFALSGTTFARYQQVATANGVRVTDLPAGDYDVQVWGANVLPTRAHATVTIGGTTPLIVAVEGAVPTTFRFTHDGDAQSNGEITLHLADGREWREVMAPAASFCRGLPHGTHRVTFALFGLHGSREFTVDAKPSTVDVLLH